MLYGRPVFPSGDTVNLGIAKCEPCADKMVGELPGLYEYPNSLYSRRRNLPGTEAAGPVAAFVKLISVVIGLSPHKQMVWITAGRVVAVVANDQTVCNRANPNFIGSTMSAHRYTATGSLGAKGSVSMTIVASDPFPTSRLSDLDAALNIGLPPLNVCRYPATSHDNILPKVTVPCQ